MSDIQELYITLQKFFWQAEVDKQSQIRNSIRLLNVQEIDFERILEYFRLRVELVYLNQLQRDINKLLEVYLHEE